MPDPGTVIVPNPAVIGDEIVIHRENTYSGIQFFIGPGWDAFLDGSNDVWFTAKKRSTAANAENLFDVQCSIVDAATGEVTADLDEIDTDIVPANNYRWQIQVRASDDSVVKVALVGRLRVEATLYGVEP